MSTKNNKNMFSERLQRVSLEKNISQADIARHFDKYTSEISRWFNAEVLPRPQNIKKIAEFLKCDSTWLETGQGEPFPPQKAADFVKTAATQEHKDNWTIDEMLEMTREVLESKTIFRPALAANVRAFHQAIQNENDMNETLKEIKAMRKENQQMSSRIAALEEMIRDMQGNNGPKREQA